MMRSLFILMLAATPGLSAAPAAATPPDLLRFVDGDQLHGSYQGIKDGGVVAWQRPDLTAPVEFKSEKIQRVILRAGHPESSAGTLSHVVLINGDRIPGTVLALDDQSVKVDSPVAGIVNLPRKWVASISPSPMGGPVGYCGPYSEDGWIMTHNKFPDGIPASVPDPDKTNKSNKAEKSDAANKEDKPDVEDKPDKSSPDEDPAAALLRWKFSGSAWYWGTKQGGTALVRKTGMTDRSMLRFHLAWRNRLALSLAFHADFSRPKPADDKADANDEADKKLRRDALRRMAMMNGMGSGEAASFPDLFGNSYVMQFNSGYVMLFRCGFDAQGQPTMDRLQVNNPSIRLAETNSAEFEIRCDRPKGQITLFVNGEQAMKWSEPPPGEDNGYAGKGSGLGFLSQMDNSPIKISDVVIADWNGMPDAARSMQADEQDIVLLTNGTDRFAGQVTGLREGKIQFHGKFGDFSFPLAEIAELHFASTSLSQPAAEDDAKPEDDQIVVRFDPIGNLTGKPLTGDASTLRLLTPSAGEVELKLDSAIMLDFQPTNHFLDDWDTSF